MKTISIVGRIMFAVPLLVFASFHFMNGQAMQAYVPKFFPAPIFWVYLVGIALVAAAVSIIINKKARLATLLLGIMLLMFVFTIHLPSVIAGGQTAQMSMTMLLKDFALAGAAFFFSGYLEN